MEVSTNFMTSSYQPEDYYRDSEDEEYLTKVVVDTCGRKFYLYSNEGETREVDCDNVEEFMNVLELVRGVCDEEIVSYAEPLVKNQL
jgi:hypothetical protein